MNSNSARTIFVGDSEMAMLMRSHDWSQTLVGSVETWPQSLRSTLSICLNSRFPIAIYWGVDCLLLYNDAWRPIVGDKHPWALGRPACEVWSEIWNDIGPELARVLATGEGTFHNDELLSMHRFGYTEECFFEYTFNPIQGQGGVVEGVFNVVTETTYRVLNERRARLLREVAAKTGIAKTAKETCALMIQAFKSDPFDIPFALLYLIDQDGKYAQLCGSTEFAPDRSISPGVIDLIAEDGIDSWSITLAVRTAQPQVIKDLPTRFGAIPGSPWSEPPQEAMVLPITATRQGKVTGVLVAVASPRRRLDDHYRDFLSQVAGQIATAIANARAYEEERKRAEALAELDRAKTTFFSNVSHEFRTPLTLMLAPLEQTLSRLDGQLPPLEREQLEIVQRNGLRLLKLVNTLLDFSRIEAGRVQAVYEPTDLVAFTTELASVFRSAIEQAGLQLIVVCESLIEPVYVDRKMWEKIVLNLLSNAFKFTFEGEIAVILRSDDAHIHLEVRDTGTGIPAEELPHIFERFHRVKGTRGRSYEGSGIGLSLVQELVRLHGGTIAVSSIVNRGTCFTVSIPKGCVHLPSECIHATPTLTSTATGVMPYVEEILRWSPWSSKLIESSQNTTCELSSISVPVQPQQPSSRTARILLADDNADMRDYVKRLLSQQYEVEAVTDGITALAAIHEQLPDLVLTDVMMPGLDGFELLRELRGKPQTQELPIILLSARAGEESRIEGLQAGADDYLTKPFSARELLARVEANLKLAQLRRDATQREQALRLEAETAQQKVETILSSISDAFVVLDRDWNFTYVNDRYCGIVDMDREALLGQNVWELFPDAADGEVYIQFQRALSQQASVQFEWLFPAWNRWFEYRVYPSPDGLTIFLAEITDRKQAEAEIQQLNQQLTHRINELQTLFDLLPIGVAIAEDPQCRRIYFNPYLSELIRVPVGQNASQSAPPPERPVYRLCKDGVEIPVEDLPMQYAARHNIEIRDEVLDIVHPDGTVVKLLCYCSPLLDEQNQVRGVLGGFVDITERIQNEAALRESEERLKIALQTGKLGSWQLDLTTGVLESSDQCKANFGLSPEEDLSYQRLFELIHPDDRAYVQETVERAITEHIDYDAEYRNIWLDGSIHWMIARGRAIYAADGTPMRMIGVTLDLTERKQAEVALRESQTLFEAFMRYSPVTAFIKDEQGRYLYVNPLNERLCNRPLADWLGKTDFELFPLAEAQQWYNHDLAALAAGEAIKVNETFRQADGEHHFIAFKFPIPQLSGRQWLGGMSLDVTAHKQAQMALQKSEEQLRLATEGANLGLWHWNVQSDRLIWTDQCKVLFGLPADTQMSYQVFLDALHPEDRQRIHEMRPVLEDGQLSRHEIEYRTVWPDGTVRWLMARGSAIYDAEGKPISSMGVIFDITDRKQAEEALRRSEERLRVSQELSLDAFTILDSVRNEAGAIVDFVWTYVNPKAAEILKRPIEELVGQRLLDVLPGNQLNSELFQRYVQVVETGEPHDIELSYNADGITGWFRNMTVKLEDGVAIFFSDITIRKQTEQALRHAEERLRVALQNAPITVFNQDRELKYTWIHNPILYDLHEMLGKRDRDFLPPQDAELLTVIKQRVLETGIGAREEIKITRNETNYYYDLTVEPLRDSNNTVIGITCAAVDISKLKQTAIDLRESEDRLRLALESAELGTWDFNLITGKLKWDEGCKAMFGLPPDAEVTWDLSASAIHPDDRERVLEATQAALNPANKGAYAIEYRTVGITDGIERWVAAKGQVYFNSAGEAVRFIGTVLNITEQKRVEVEREQLLAREQAAREAAEAANRIKDEFLAVVSHELRAPLNPILGWAKLLRNHQLDEQKTDRALEVIERNAKMQAQLINDLLDVSRILRGKLSLDISPVDLVSTIQAAIETVRLAAEAKSIQIHTLLEPQVGYVSGDCGRLQQVVWNLLSNAVKFTSEGGRVDIRLERINSQAQITVSDTGKGISPDFLPYVFDHFRQESAATTRRFGGLGLGLAIVRYLVELHGGTVQADSIGEGQGATFTVKLPLMPHQPMTNQDTTKLSEPSLNFHGIRILVVDDDDNTREFLTFLLELHRANVTAVTTASEAIAMLTHLKPDLLLSDIGMPDVDGYMLMRQIRALPPEQGGIIPAIALTAYAGEIDQQQAMAAGFQKHIAKPIDPQVLLQAIAELGYKNY
ncbi:PAS domain S-box protein [Chlorogloeopsis sp. ULAP02]|uniref:PAS domain S-box protein n=1 Tax=Chlorogloeopsis sp. ULAP02 TaxID=3107926 RepID=UPI003135553E